MAQNDEQQGTLVNQNEIDERERGAHSATGASKTDWDAVLNGEMGPVGEYGTRDENRAGVDTVIGSVGKIGTSTGVGTGRGASSELGEDEMGGPGTSDEA